MESVRLTLKNPLADDTGVYSVLASPKNAKSPSEEKLLRFNVSVEGKLLDSSSRSETQASNDY